MIPIYKPYLNPQNLKYAHDAINSGWISSHGKYLDSVKEDLKNLLDCQKIILTNNGTSATHLLSIALKYKHPNIKKIIVPNNVYVAAWNSFLFDKNYELIPIDSNLDTWNFEHNILEKINLSDTAILVVHNIGNVINVPELKKKYPDCIFIEDNCEGFLGKYQGDYSGTKSFASSVSFFANKTITSGEGGAFITNDEDVFEYINTVRNQGQSELKFIHNVLGYNYRMTNIQAGILKGQLENLSEIIEMKNEVFKNYYDNLNTIERIKFQISEKNTEHSKWMFGIRISDISYENKKKLEHHLYESGIEVRPMFYDIKKHKYLSNIDSSTINSEILQKECLILPSFPELTKSQINFICNKIKNFIKKNL